MNIYFVASVWVAMALAASVISIRLGISVALVEILVGAIGAEEATTIGHRGSLRGRTERAGLSDRPGPVKARLPGVPRRARRSQGL